MGPPGEWLHARRASDRLLGSERRCRRGNQDSDPSAHPYGHGDAPPNGHANPAPHEHRNPHPAPDQHPDANRDANRDAIANAAANHPYSTGSAVFHTNPDRSAEPNPGVQP